MVRSFFREAATQTENLAKWHSPFKEPDFLSPLLPLIFKTAKPATEVLTHTDKTAAQIWA